jgi:hypothetical protein
MSPHQGECCERVHQDTLGSASPATPTSRPEAALSSLASMCFRSCPAAFFQEMGPLLVPPTSKPPAADGLLNRWSFSSTRCPSFISNTLCSCRASRRRFTQEGADGRRSSRPVDPARTNRPSEVWYPLALHPASRKNRRSCSGALPLSASDNSRCTCSRIGAPNVASKSPIVSRNSLQSASSGSGVYGLDAWLAFSSSYRPTRTPLI